MSKGDNGPKPNIVPFLLLSSLSMPLLTIGILGLVSSELVPWFARPALAWSAIGVGAVLDIAAVLSLLKELRRVNRARPSTRGTAQQIFR